MSSTALRPRSAQELRDVLLPSVLHLPRYWWVALLLVTSLGAVLRFVGLAWPQAVVFDETYYLKDAYSLLLRGTEQQWPEGADEGFVAGTPPVPLDQPSFVVHPPLGKWLIAGGLWAFGAENPFGWRFSAAVIGTLSIAVIWWAGWLLFRSVWLATVAGLLLALDGLHLVQSRLALLDIFLMFFLLLAFTLLLMDRNHARRRMVAKYASPGFTSSGLGPWLGVRWWRLAAGVACGAAVAVKWNALFVVAALGILTVLWDLNLRRTAGVKHWISGGLVKDAPQAFLETVGVGLLTYVSTWVGWLTTSGGYDRQWAQSHPGEGLTWLPAPLRSLAEYHRAAYEFHAGLDSDHTYMAGPGSWLFMGRPTSYFYESPERGVEGCGVDACSQAIVNLGNPAVWWIGIVGIVAAAAVWLWRRDWRFGALLGPFAAAYLPWFLYPERTMFFFYALSFLPFVILMITGGMGLLTGRMGLAQYGHTADTAQALTQTCFIPAAQAHRWRIVCWVFLGVVAALTVFFWPVWTGQTIPYEHWRWRMWFERWI